MSQETKSTVLYRVAKDRRNLHLPVYPDENLINNVSALDEAKSNYSFTWSGSINSKSRFSDGSWAVLYTAENVNTAIAECIYHLHKKHFHEFDDDEDMPFPLVHYTLGFSGTILNLHQAGYDFLDLVKPTYEKCHEIAREYKNSVCAFVTPSARQIDNICCPIFNKESITKIIEAWAVGIITERNTNILQVTFQGHSFEVKIDDVYHAQNNDSD